LDDITDYTQHQENATKVEHVVHGKSKRVGFLWDGQECQYEYERSQKWAALFRGNYMPDFDLFERLLKDVLEGKISIQDGAVAIANLPEENKVQVVKSRSARELEGFLGRAHTTLRNFFPSGSTFTSSQNNKSGKDLLETKSGTQVELKSGGAMTDGNPGLESVAWALDTPAVAIVMKSGMDDRRKLLIAGHPRSAIDASKSKSMDELYQALRRTSLGPASARLSHYFRCMAVGLTKLEEIKSSFSSPDPVKTPLLLKAEWTRGLVLYEKAFLPTETIEVVRIERTTDRAHLIAKGLTTGRTATLYPNFKNSWTASNGRKFPADNWVATACFHVWID
jgi:hypothetical protein